MAILGKDMTFGLFFLNSGASMTLFSEKVMPHFSNQLVAAKNSTNQK